MLAFGRGLEAGADHLETDLHRTADDHLVCFHDESVDRTTDGAGSVGSYTLAELRRLDAGYNHRVDGAFPFRGRGLRVPTLGEVLATFSSVGVVVDIKVDGLEDPLTDILEKMNAWERVIVGSFSDVRLLRMRHRSADQALVSAGPLTARAWWLASRLRRSGPLEFPVLQLPMSVNGVRLIDRRLVETAHANGTAVHVWTVNQPAEIDRMWALGVDAIITDRADVAPRGGEAA